MICPIYAQAKKNPNSIALVTPRKNYSYHDFNQLVCSTEQTLKKKKVKRGTRVALISKNSLEYMVYCAALIRIGGVAVLLSPRLPKKAIKEQLKQARCNILFSEKQLHIAEASTDKNKKTIDLNNPCTIMFTSGTSGKPKPVTHTVANHWYSALGSNKHIPLKEKDQWVLSLPLYHVGGISILWRCWQAGASIVLPSLDIQNTIEKTQSTHFSFVPTQLIRLLNNKRTIETLQKSKAILLGGSIIPSAVISQCIEAKLPLYTSYGLTEMSSQVATSKKIKKVSDAQKLKVLIHRSVKVSKGEIHVKGKTLAKKEKNWFATGDLGFIQSGYLYITGRKDNQFISGGENILPEEIEQALMKHKDIDEAVVVSVPHKEFGRRPVAFVKGSNTTKQQINKFLLKHLPKFKVPDYYLPLPKKKGLKHNRKELEKKAQYLIAHSQELA